MNEVGMGLIHFGSHILEGKGEPELSHRQIERNSKFYTHFLERIASSPCDACPELSNTLENYSPSHSERNL